MQVNIDNDVDIGVVVSNDVDIDLDVDDNTLDLEKALDPYTGEYVVEPKNYEQVLDTQGKKLIQRLQVLEIPFSVTQTVDTDGYTVTIG